MTLTTVGWMVVHSLWQVTLVAGIAALLTGLLRRSRPNTRYRVALVALGVAAAVPIATAISSASAWRWRVPEAALRVADQRIDMTVVIWWASVLVPIAGALWLTGLVVGATRLVVAARRVHVLRRDASAAGNRTLTRLARRMSRRLSLDRVPVRCSARASVPMVIGWRRPVILLPAATMQQLGPRQLRALLAHEFEHVRRGDIAANFVQLLIDLLLFHHPAARWLSGVVRSEREYCCDDAAVASVRDPREYIRALARLEDARATTPFAVAARSGTLLDRVRRMAGEPRRALTPVRGALACLAALLLSTVVYGATLLVPPGLPWRAEVRARRPGPLPPKLVEDGSRQSTERRRQ